MIPSYPKVWAFGGRIPVNPFDGKPAVIQEKVDGSQFSFRRVDGRLFMRSKGQEQTIEHHDNMFNTAVDQVLGRVNMLSEGAVYRGEYLNKPKHNTLAYARVPLDNIALFDIDFQLPDKTFAPGTPQLVADQAAFLNFDVVPTLAEEVIESADQLLEYLECDSFLGGQKVEGVVLKRYDLFVPQFSSPLFCKYVSERFKEVHHKDWKNRNPSGKDYMALLADTYRTEARWEKAVQHLRERGDLEESPRDIGKLMKEISADVLHESEDEMKEALFKHFWKTHGSRAVSRGAPEWYKERLLRESFEVS